MLPANSICTFDICGRKKKSMKILKNQKFRPRYQNILVWRPRAQFIQLSRLVMPYSPSCAPITYDSALVHFTWLLRIAHLIWPNNFLCSITTRQWLMSRTFTFIIFLLWIMYLITKFTRLIQPAFIFRDPCCTFPCLSFHLILRAFTVACVDMSCYLFSHGEYGKYTPREPMSSSLTLSAFQLQACRNSACSWCNQTDFSTAPSKTFWNVNKFITKYGWLISHIFWFMLYMSDKGLCLGWRVTLSSMETSSFQRAGPLTEAVESIKRPTYLWTDHQPSISAGTN